MAAFLSSASANSSRQRGHAKTGLAGSLLLAVVCAIVSLLQWCQSRSGPNAASSSTALDASHSESGCVYVTPADCPDSQGWKGMERLTDSTWIAEKGRGDGKHMLVYVYGKTFEGRGQIAAWKYNTTTNFIELYYSKSHCPGMCHDCCNGGTSNEPGPLSSRLNPSARLTLSPFGSYTLVNKFLAGDDVTFPFGSATLRNVGGLWRLESKQHGCFLDHVYACSQDSFVARGRKIDGRTCVFE